MEIVNRKVRELTPYAKNPRKNADAVQYVAASIKEFGFKVPVIIDSAGEIVAGHTRVLAAKQLGLEVVPCIVADDLSEEQVKAFRLSDNQTASIATWDIELLNTELLDLEANFDMADFGFEIFPPGDYGTDFQLQSGEKEPFTQMTFTFADKQAELIKTAIQTVRGEIFETFGNENSNGNALYEVVRQWAQKM